MRSSRTLWATVMQRARNALWARRARKAVLVVDRPVNGEEFVGGSVQTSGWVHARAGISSVDIAVNGGSSRAARLGLHRPDVAEQLRDPGTRTAGWVAAISISELREGENVVRVTASGPTTKPITCERHFHWRKLAVGEVPYDQVDLSGERYDPRFPYANSVAIEHRARYLLASSIAEGKRILDAGCGFGYGAQMLAAAGAASVDALDASSPVVAQAQRMNDGRLGVRFRVGDARELPYPDDAFDLIACFETLEHMLEHDKLLDEFRRTLAPGGVLLISTPNRDRYLANNPWHLKELTPEELEAVLRARFANVVVLRQQLHIASVLGDETVLSHVDAENDMPARLLKLSGGAPGSEIFDLGIASDGPLPAFETVVAVGDARDELVDATITHWSTRAIRAEAESSMLRTRLAVARTFGHFRDELPAPRGPEAPEVTREALREEMDGPTFWMYDWDFGELGRVDAGPLSHIHRTRLELIEPYVRQALRAGGPNARVLDLACSEGWFGHRMLEWGAKSVIGIDIRPQNIRRAQLIRDYFGISPESLGFYEGDVFSLPELGRFDVVLMLGLVYHLENPVGALRIAHALTGSLLVVESQLTQQREPILAGNGGAGVYHARPGSFAAWHEEDQDINPVASYGSVLSLIPNEAALLEMARVAGFAACKLLEAGPGHEQQYRDGERVVMIAWAV